MSDVRLVILEAGREWSGTVHGSSADRAIAALSADPTTLAELEVAYARFARPRPNGSFFANLLPGMRDEPHDAGIVVIDLVARLVVVDSTYSAPGRTGTVCYHDGECATATRLRYHLADDWLLIHDRRQWPAVAGSRRREGAGRPLPHMREIFYGRPLLEFVAREAFVAFHRQTTTDAPRREAPPGSSNRWSDADAAYDTLKQIHAAWLLTPRDDLGGACPRDVALARREHLARDLQDQCDRWSLLGECPPGLDVSSLAYRHGGFGTHELVQYYHLVRELLWSCWQRLVDLRTSRAVPSGAEMLADGDFSTAEVPRLERVRDQWLETPDSEYRGRTPRSIIDRERARLPEVASAHEALIDADCPCCQMSAELPGPLFWHLDGSEMDDEFAFDLNHRTREEWDAERRRWEEFAKDLDARSGPKGGASGEEPVWSSSFSVADAADVPLSIRLFGIGGHLAELIADIRRHADGSAVGSQIQRLIDRLNRDFGNLRELQTSEPAVADALLGPLIDRFIDSLAAVASSRPDLSLKCGSLTSCLTSLLNDRSPGSGWDSGESDLPF